MRNKVNIKGFSLVEMLVVILVFSILAILSTQALISTLRGSKKSESVGQVRENIDFAMNSMERLLRNTQEIVSCTNTKLVYVDENYQTGSFTCDNSNKSIASGSANIRLTSSNVAIDCSLPVFKCPVPLPGVPPSIEISITATDATLGSSAEGAKVTSKTKILLRTY